MPGTSRVIVFDVNETLSDLSSVTTAFEAVGASSDVATAWFAALLRDGFALATTRDQASFLQIAEHSARMSLEKLVTTQSLDTAVASILAAFGTVTLHPDVAEGIRQLKSDGHRLFTLSNGSTATAERLFGEAGLDSSFDALLSVADHTAWKPAREAYERASVVSGVPLPGLTLVAVHPWDIHGAARAGMNTAWIDRDASTYPAYFEQPSITATSILDLARKL